MTKLNQRQERFCQNIFKGMTQREAWINAGYSSNYPLDAIDQNACKLANSTKIQQRYAELNKKTEDNTIATVKERKRRLTEFLREDNYSKFGINRQSNIQASDQLNKMDKVYSNDAGGNTIVVNIEQAVIDAGNRLDSALKRLSERVLPEALESKPDGLLEDNNDR